MFSWNGLRFSQDAEVYSPKPASLLLAEWASKEIADGSIVLDVCTGSGVVAITIAKNLPRTTVTASDISDVALGVVTDNANLNEVAVVTVKSDMFAAFSDSTFDVITAHPPAIPYLPDQDWGMTTGMAIATNGGEDGSRFVLRTDHSRD